MFDAKKYLYLIVLLCFLTISLPFHLWAEEGSKKVASDQQKAESQQKQASTQDQPRITFDSSHYDAGEVFEGDEMVHTFTVKNTGTAQLNISKVRAGWGCTVASFDKAIPPGQEGKITLKVRTGNRKGKFSKSATVHSNDPQKPKTKISLSCFVKQHISVKPGNQIKLVGYEGDKVKEKITITSNEEQPLKIIDITCDIKDKIKYKLKTKKKGKEYTLEIKNRSKKVGFFRGKIELKTNSKKKPLIVLSIYSNLKKEVGIRPSSLSFGTIDTTKEKFDSKKLNKKVTLRDVRGDGLTIKKIKPSSDWILTETRTKKEGKNYTIVITLDKDKLPKGQFEEKIKIRTNYKRKPLVVGVKGEVI